MSTLATDLGQVVANKKPVIGQRTFWTLLPVAWFVLFFVFPVIGQLSSGVPITPPIGGGGLVGWGLSSLALATLFWIFVSEPRHSTLADILFSLLWLILVLLLPNQVSNTFASQRMSSVVAQVQSGLNRAGDGIKKDLSTANSANADVLKRGESVVFDGKSYQCGADIPSRMLGNLSYNTSDLVPFNPLIEKDLTKAQVMWCLAANECGMSVKTAVSCGFKPPKRMWCEDEEHQHLLASSKHARNSCNRVSNVNALSFNKPNTSEKFNINGKSYEQVDGFVLYKNFKFNPSHLGAIQKPETEMIEFNYLKKMDLNNEQIAWCKAINQVGMSVGTAKSCGFIRPPAKWCDEHINNLDTEKGLLACENPS